nr:MAG TPA: hypothetical protein [Caudoviricetes sp.]
MFYRLYLTRIYPYLMGFLPIIYAFKTVLTEYRGLKSFYNLKK